MSANFPPTRWKKPQGVGAVGGSTPKKPLPRVVSHHFSLAIVSECSLICPPAKFILKYMRHNNISLYFPAAEIAIWLRDGIVTGWGVHLKITLYENTNILNDK